LQRRYVGGFETVPEQHEAKRLLGAALQEGPAHAYLFHGPAGVGKRDLARRFAAELLGDHARVERGSHPDLYVLEPLGEQIRIDDVRELRRDLHMRPFEAERRVYLIFGADSLNEDAADALLKDLEEPPPYAVVVLVAERLGPLPETIRSRCQLVPFRRLSEPAVLQGVREHAPDLGDEEVTTLARVAGGRLGRALQLLDPAAARRRETLLGVARAVYAKAGFEPADGVEALLAGISERGAEAKEEAEVQVASLELTGRDADQRVRRAQRGAEREELLGLLEELESWYRDLVVVAVGAEPAVVHVDRLEELREDATVERIHAAEEACELVRAAWREAEELQVSTPLALEALLIRLHRELGGTAAVA
jgi:DNA polymerase III subunit delta'